MHVRQSRIMPAIWLTHPSGTNRQHECLGVGALWDAAVPQLHARDRREARLGTARHGFGYVCLPCVGGEEPQTPGKQLRKKMFDLWILLARNHDVKCHQVRNPGLTMRAI